MFPHLLVNYRNIKGLTYDEILRAYQMTDSGMHANTIPWSYVELYL